MGKVRECGTKRRHENKWDAERHVWSLAKAGARKSRIKTYKCPHCGGWHVGHKGRRG